MRPGGRRADAEDGHKEFTVDCEKGASSSTMLNVVTRGRT